MSKINLLLVIELLVVLIPARSAEISLSSYSGKAGSSVPAAVSFAAQGMAVSAVQFDLDYDSSVMSIVFSLAEAGRGAQKSLYTADLGANKKRLILIGPNSNLLPDGVLINALVNLKTGVPTGKFPLKVSLVVCSDPDGRAAAVTGVDGDIVVQQSPAEVFPLRQEGVLNAASLLPGPIAPGEIITLIGSSIGPATAVQYQTGTIGTMLGGTRLLLNGIASPLLYVSTDQINAVVPYAVSGTNATLVIENQGQKRAELTVPVTTAAPAIFTQNASGSGPGAILNQDSSLNTLANPASRGSVVSLYAMGAGQTDPPGRDAQIADTTTLPKSILPVSVQVGDTAAEVLYAGPSPGQISNLLQVNFRVPDSDGPLFLAPVVIQIKNLRSQTGVTMAVN
jgi:uncharacterized protein (TIGR03437 family)